MFNPNNLSFKVDGLNFLSIVGNRHSSEYSPNLLNVQLGLLDLKAKMPIGSQYSVSLGISTQLSLLSGLSESIISIDDTEIGQTTASKTFVQGYVSLLQINGGMGTVGLTGNEAFKKKLTIASDFASAKNIQGNATGTTNPGTPHTLYSNTDVLINFYHTQIQEFNNKVAAAKDPSGTETELLAVHTALANIGVGNLTLKEGRFTSFSSFTNYVTNLTDIDMFQADTVDLPVTLTKLLKSWNNNNTNHCQEVFNITSTPFDTGGRPSSTTASRPVNYRVFKKSGGPECTIENILSQQDLTNMVEFRQVGSQGTEQPCSIEEFFSGIGSNVQTSIDLGGDNTRKIWLIGYLNSSAVCSTNRTISAALMPQFELTIASSGLSLRGISFETAGITIETPLLAQVTDIINSWLTFNFTSPVALDLVKGQRPAADAFEDFSNTVVSTAYDKSISDTVRRQDSTAFNEIVSSHCVQPFAKDQVAEYFTWNFGIRAFTKLNDPLFNIFTAAGVYFRQIGKERVIGISLGTVYNFISLN